jgi:hypothetical protein
VAKVFWISSSVNVRVVSEEKSGQILTKISHDKCSTWHESKEHITVWNQQRLAVVTHYVKKVRYYTDLFLRTEGGILFREAVDKSRKRKTALPTLDIDTLRNFNGKPGLPWSYATVFDIFSQLTEVHGGDNLIHVEVCYTDYLDN